ncbi:unnamed protein product [Albugo candida]|nr:unnamed protein product [Albugo candida]|eukprot:CCI47869.1 unnamed protein product [Albugo candida]
MLAEIAKDSMEIIEQTSKRVYEQNVYAKKQVNAQVQKLKETQTELKKQQNTAQTEMINSLLKLQKQQLDQSAVKFANQFSLEKRERNGAPPDANTTL